VAAQYLSEHYGAPAMLMALLLGIAFHFLSEEGGCVRGIEFTARTVLRIGVALLGARIGFDLLAGLGTELILLIILGVVATIAFGLTGAALLGRGWRFGVLTGASVAICGASAAMAVAAVLPNNENSERNLLFTVLSVTVLSTVAMILYPVLSYHLNLDHQIAGVFLGGTIHDVAQVVGAGFSVSETTGETATLVKLIRVTMLAPVVVIISLLVRHYSRQQADTGKRPALIPTFIVAFLCLAALNSVGMVPASVQSLLGEVYQWMLLVSIAAVGMKTSLRKILDVGGPAIILLVAETVFIGAFILLGIHFLR
ncbi:MAG TPA: putative sulfate exporter family transporter, partial [Gammaproteobacteria bacterium]|nr:putative sulfate exporter family transporter [Gammaproteobacteria bacterium]